MAWTPTGGPPPLSAVVSGTATFFAFYLLLVLVMGLWSRLLARRIAATNIQRSLRRYNRMVVVARLMVPLWFAIGIWVLNWGWAVQILLRIRHDSDNAFGEAGVQFPRAILGTLPGFLAWMGLWWAQFPADRSLREQNMLAQLDADLPLSAPPGFRSYFMSNLRLQLLFTIVPVLLIILMRDLGMSIGQWWIRSHPLPEPALQQRMDLIEFLVWMISTIMVFISAPEILRLVLNTQPLPDSPLRRRLEALCRRSGVRYRNILLWRTQNNMGNAAVMGVLPWVRYVLLTDLLIETMTDEQIEAVFAHEIGHVVHRHLIWLALSVVIVMLALAGPGATIEDQLRNLHLPSWVPPLGVLMTLIGGVGFVVVFGFISRHLERQADVYAARTIQSARGLDIAPVRGPVGTIAYEPSSFVGQYGASAVASALHRVAVVNNIPVKKWELLHGSIASRMHYLQGLSIDPSLTSRFDRFMVRLYCVLILILFASTAIFVFK